MTGLLEIREKVKRLYSRYEAFFLPILKFLLAFVVLSVLNGKIGYMTRIDNIAIVLIVALACSFLPTNFIVIFAAAFSLAHMYALSLEVALVGGCVYLVMFLLFFRFSPKDTLLVLLTPLLCSMKIPYIIPVAAGLVCAPTAIVSVGCGVAVYYLLHIVSEGASTIGTLGSEDATAKIRLVIDGLIGNKAMPVVIAAFAITILAVYLIRRMSISHAWTIAMAVGVLTDIVVLLIGDLLYDINVPVGGVLIGSILAFGVGKVLEFFRFCVDYDRAEKVQFEDDEYYYYVRAVPKMSVAAPSKTVKRINAPQNRSGRSVTTERTVSGRNVHAGAQRVRDEYRGGKSITVGSAAADSDGEYEEEDYEDLF